MEIMDAIQSSICGLNALGFLAAPRVFFAERAGKFEGDVNAIVRAHLEKFVATIRQLPDCTDNVAWKAAAPQVASLIADLPADLRERVPPVITEKARAILAILGEPGPPEGWDDYRPE